jgi:hypothetical protein
MSRGIHNLIKKDLECTKCGEVQSIQRLKNRNRGKGHIKHLWCIKCKEKTAHIEL